MFINNTGIIYTFLNYATINITGHLFLTLLGLFIILITFGLMFKMPFELVLIFTLPITLVLLAFISEFLAIGGAILIVLGWILSKQIFQ